MRFTAAYDAADNALSFFFEALPTVIALDEVELAFTHSSAAPLGVLLGEVAWHSGLFCGSNAFTFDQPLLTSRRVRDMADGSLRLWSRLRLRVLDEAGLRRYFASDPAVREAHEPAAAVAVWFAELTVDSHAQSQVVVLSGTPPTDLSPARHSFVSSQMPPVGTLRSRGRLTCDTCTNALLASSADALSRWCS